MSDVLMVSCPTCGKKTPYNPENPFRPFCCKECQLIDLGAWANDEYRIEGDPGSAMTLSPEEYQAADQARIQQEQKKNRT